MAQPERMKLRKRLPPARAPSKGTLRLAVVLIALVGINLYVFLWRGETSIPAVMEQAAMANQKETAQPALDGVAKDKGDSSAGAKSDADGSDTGGDDADDVDDIDDVDVADDKSDGTPPAGDRWVEGEVQSGDSLGRILRREDMSPPEADEVIRALTDHMDFRKIRPGQTYRIRFDVDGRLQEFEFHLDRTQVIRAIRSDDGKLIGKKDETATELRIQELGGRIDSSLYAAVKRAGEDTSLVSFFVDVFAYDVNFYTDTHPGDTFRLLVEKEYVGDDFLRYNRVLAAEYSGKAGTFRALHWQPPGESEGRHFDEEGRSVEKSMLKTPLKFARVSSKFNPNRMHPILHKRRGHMGVDYAAPTGTPVWAAASGKIVFRGWKGGAGNCVIISHDNGLQTVYMHLSKFQKGQEVGTRIKGKTVIGYVGTTGLSTGPHLHFGVKKNGRYVDPLTLEPTRRKGVAKKHEAAFKAHARAMLQRLASITVPGSS